MFSESSSLGTSGLARQFAAAFGDDDPDEEFLIQEQLAGDDFEVDEREIRDEERVRTSVGDAPSNRRVTDLIREVEFRGQVVGAKYPLEVDASGVTLRSTWREAPEYPFLALLAARVSMGVDISHHRPARMFEELVAVALAEFLGGEGLRFGWPAAPGETFLGFPQKVRDLASKLQEIPGAMRNVSPDSNDYALDVVAWRQFDDDKPEEATPGQIVILCQCGIGKDWREKTIDLKKWDEVIQFSGQTLGGLAFPHLPSREDEKLHIWFDIATAPSIPFDRLRLASLLESATLAPEVRAEVIDWVDQTNPLFLTAG